MPFQGQQISPGSEYNSDCVEDMGAVISHRKYPFPV